MGDLDPCNSGFCGVEDFEAYHLGSDAFDKAMILPKYIIDLLDLQDISRRSRTDYLRMTFADSKQARLAPRLSMTTRSRTPWVAWHL